MADLIGVQAAPFSRLFQALLQSCERVDNIALGAGVGGIVTRPGTVAPCNTSSKPVSGHSDDGNKGESG